MTKDEALKLALYGLEIGSPLIEDFGSTEQLNAQNKAIAAIYEAFAQPEQEPVAWGVFDHNLHDMFFAKEEAQEMVRLKGDGSTVKPLYTTPPQRTWVGLTRTELIKCGVLPFGMSYELCQAIEAKLKEKNI